MSKVPFMEELESKLRPEECVFKFRSAELYGNYFTLELLLDKNAYDDVLTDYLKEKVKKSAEEIIPASFKLNLKFIRAVNDRDGLAKHIMEFIYKEKPTLYKSFQTANIEFDVKPDIITCEITLEKYLYEYAKKSGLKEDLEKCLSAIAMEDINVEFFECPNSDSDTEIGTTRKQSNVLGSALKTITVSIEKYYSGNIAQSPRYIRDVKEAETQQVCLCGVISNVKTRFIEKLDKNLYTFNINDTTSLIKVKYFEKQLKGVRWEEVFKDGESLVMEGQIKFDNYDREFEFFPRNIAKCIIDYGSIDLSIKYLPEPKNYTRVFPQKIEIGNQYSLLAPEMNKSLMTNVFVVFDLETTGLESSVDKIIEIAAVKVIDGEICESFSCFVNPEMPLPDKIVEITNITDDMLADAYTIDMILGDFYKFTRNTILVAHNAPFDIGFLTFNGNKYGYNFDNSFMDTLSMARSKLKKKSGNDLGSLCKNFNISLVGAHRAINDALATAKLFIELMNLQQ